MCPVEGALGTVFGPFAYGGLPPNKQANRPYAAPGRRGDTSAPRPARKASAALSLGTQTPAPRIQLPYLLTSLPGLCIRAACLGNQHGFQGLILFFRTPWWENTECRFLNGFWSSGTTPISTLVSVSRGWDSCVCPPLTSQAKCFHKESQGACWGWGAAFVSNHGEQGGGLRRRGQGVRPQPEGRISTREPARTGGLEGLKVTHGHRVVSCGAGAGQPGKAKHQRGRAGRQQGLALTVALVTTTTEATVGSVSPGGHPRCCCTWSSSFNLPCEPGAGAVSTWPTGSRVSGPLSPRSLWASWHWPQGLLSHPQGPSRTPAGSTFSSRPATTGTCGCSPPAAGCTRGPTTGRPSWTASGPAELWASPWGPDLRAPGSAPGGLVLRPRRSLWDIPGPLHVSPPPPSPARP